MLKTLLAVSGLEQIAMKLLQIHLLTAVSVPGITYKTFMASVTVVLMA
jgi:hypothetical protein